MFTGEHLLWAAIGAVFVMFGLPLIMGLFNRGK